MMFTRTRPARLCAVFLILIQIASPAPARGETAQDLAARYLAREATDEPSQNIAWDNLQLEERLALEAEVNDRARLGPYLDSLRKRDYDAHFAPRGMYEGPRDAQYTASATFSQFIDGWESRGNSVDTFFQMIARNAPEFADFKTTENLPSAVAAENIDTHLRILAKNFTAQMFNSLDAKQSPTAAVGEADVGKTLRFLAEAYAVAGNTKGVYETIRRATIEPIISISMNLGTTASLAAVVMTLFYRDTIPAIYPVAAVLTMAAAYAFSATLALRESLIKRFDRPLRGLESKAILKHRNAQVRPLIDRFWTYVGDEIERRALINLHRGDDALARNLRSARALLREGPSAPVAARAVVRRQLLALDGTGSLVAACEASLKQSIPWKD